MQDLSRREARYRRRSRSCATARAGRSGCVVLVGDEAGRRRNARDAIDMKPDRFVGRPLSTKALRFAVQSGLEMVARARGEPGTPAPSGEAGNDPVAPAVTRTPTPVRGSGA